MINSILVGVDGSPGSARALEWAISRAVELDAEVVAVYGLRPVAEFVMGVPPLDFRAMLVQAKDALEHRWCAPLQAAGVRYRAELVEDDPVGAILGVAECLGSDMIVLGAHGHGGVVDRLLGGVTYKVAHRASQPVVIVPLGKR